MSVRRREVEKERERNIKFQTSETESDATDEIEWNEIQICTRG